MNDTQTKLNGYKCFHKGKTYDIYAETTYQAQQLCAKIHGIKKAYDITVMLCEKAGEQVEHSTSII